MPDETEVITLGEQEDEPDRPVETDIITFDEQDTRSLLRPVPRRASPHDDLSVAESKHVLFDEAEDPRPSLRPVPPNDTRDGDPDELNLRGTAGVPSQPSSSEDPCTRLRPVPRRKCPGDDLSVAEESPQIPSLKHVPSDEHAVEIEEPWPTLKPAPPKGKSHGKQTSTLKEEPPGSNSTEETRPQGRDFHGPPDFRDRAPPTLTTAKDSSLRPTEASTLDDALHKDGGLIRWTRPATGLPRMARAFNKVALLRQAAQKWQPDFEKYVEELMDSLTGEEFEAFFPTEEALRYFTYCATHQCPQMQYGARLRFL